MAIKTLEANQISHQQVEQHLKEVELLAKLDHPNIVKLIGVEDEVRSLATFFPFHSIEEGDVCRRRRRAGRRAGRCW